MTGRSKWIFFIYFFPMQVRGQVQVSVSAKLAGLAARGGMGLSARKRAGGEDGAWICLRGRVHTILVF